MKKLSFELTPGFFLFCILIFIASFFLSILLFFWNSHFFCSAFEINSSCKISLIKGEDFDENVSNKGLKGFSLWHFFTEKDYDDRKNALKNSCENGNQVSCFYHGLNLKTDGQGIKSFFINSCEKGSIVSACYESGLEFMKLGKKDKSQYYFLKACNSGNILACLLAAKQSDSEESFKEAVARFEEKLMSYRSSNYFEFADRQGNVLKREISSQTAKEVMDNELSLFFPEAAEVFLKVGNSKEGIYYLEKAIKTNKYDLYQIIDSCSLDVINQDPKVVDIIETTLKDIEKEIEISKEMAKKI